MTVTAVCQGVAKAGHNAGRARDGSCRRGEAAGKRILVQETESSHEIHDEENNTAGDQGEPGAVSGIMAIVALGVGLFAGLKITKTVMVGSADAFWQAQQLYDYRLVSTLGFEEEDVQALLAQTEGLALLKGKWIEVDHARLKQLLEEMERAKSPKECKRKYCSLMS